MKDDRYTELICKGYCRYYKGGKEELRCGGYCFLLDNFTLDELELLIREAVGNNPDLKHSVPPDNKELMSLVCGACDFRIDGCDYFENRSGPPCGGFILIHALLGH